MLQCHGMADLMQEGVLVQGGHQGRPVHPCTHGNKVDKVVLPASLAQCFGTPFGGRTSREGTDIKQRRTGCWGDKEREGDGRQTTADLPEDLQAGHIQLCLTHSPLPDVWLKNMVPPRPPLLGWQKPSGKLITLQCTRLNW
jgi:hypothetical protein